MAADLADLMARYADVRAYTEYLAGPLAPEDQVVQSMPDVSPTKWHRAHTTWFFETFILENHATDYAPVNPGYRYLFNSYYEAVGPRHARVERGLISRPTVAEVALYRHAVDQAMGQLAAGADEPTAKAIEPLLELGLHHEQQHQELLLMDIKHVLSCNPLDPAYHAAPAPPDGATATTPAPVNWLAVELPDDLAQIGHAAEDGFAFDNESPRHRALVFPFRIADRVVTCGDWLEFMADGGYERPEFWLSEGWATVQQLRWRAPLYWHHEGGHDWSVFTLHGRQAVNPAEPVVHVSLFEADAYAHWAGGRLPTEQEWEVAARMYPGTDPVNDASTGRFHPAPAATTDPANPGLRQVSGDVWEWTASAYQAYPGFRRAAGAIGEYNGKFMCNQNTLRGGACVTPAGHSRLSYRNFFPPSARWAFSGLRLASDA